MPNTELQSRQAILRFDKRVFSLPAVKKAAYKYINVFTADINLDRDEIICALTFTPPLNDELSSRLLEDFKKEVLDQDLREQIRSETEPIRKLIFALAFSKTGIASNGQVPSD
jgi:His-Xaa-Ser system protein HxsD